MAVEAYLTPESQETVSESGVTATLSCDYDGTVTVEVSSTSYYWRINGTKSGGDHGTYYIYDTKEYSDSFSADNNHNYAFQVCVSGNWSNGKVFNVQFEDYDDEGGDDSGGGGGSSGSSYFLTIKQGVGTRLTVIRSWDETLQETIEDPIFSPEDGYDPISFSVIPNKDNHEIECEPEEGYELDYYNYDSSTQLGFKVTNLTRKYNEKDQVYRYVVSSNADARIESTAKPKQYELTLETAKAKKYITINRIYSNHPDATIGQFTSSIGTHEVYHGDKLEIVFDEGVIAKVGETEHDESFVYEVVGPTSIDARIKSYQLTFNVDPSVTVTARRTSSPLEEAPNTTFTNEVGKEETIYDDIYHSDVITITFETSEGYQPINKLINSGTFEFGEPITVKSNIEVFIATDLSGCVRIFNGTSFDRYLVFIFNGETWDQYIPYIYDGSNWNICI